MAVKFCRLFIRPNVDVAFPTDSVELSEYISTKYVGKCLAWREITTSEDNLIREYKSTWVSLEELKLAQEDTVVQTDFVVNMELYCIQHEIFTHKWIE